jgi:tripartite-type tricarboxylate transporter receptor subunit TctC
MLNYFIKSAPIFGLFVLGISSVTFVHAQNFPDKAVTMVVGFPAGGGTDIVARKVATPLSVMWNQPVVIDNKGGAGGTIATTQVARSAANGHTIMMATMGNMAINQHLYNLTTDPAKELSPITNVVGISFVLVARTGLAANNVEELISMAKKKPNELNYSSSGIGGAPHLAVELFGFMTGTSYTHVVYKGSGPSIADLLAGQVDFTMDSLVQVLPLIKSGRLKALAVLGSKRSPLLPQVPTISESGVSGYEFTNWFGLVAPAQTPKPIIQKLFADVSKVLQSAELRSELEKMGADVINNTPEQFGAQIQSDVLKWGEIVHKANVKAQ